MGELRFKEIAEKVMAGELSQQQGADALGMPRSTFMFHMNKEFPDRPKGLNVRKENRIPGSGRPHVATYLEANYTDETLCRDLACRHCPLNRPGEKCKSPEGLIKAMMAKVPLKGDGKVLYEYKTGTPDPDTVELQLENYRKALKGNPKDLEEKCLTLKREP